MHSTIRRSVAALSVALALAAPAGRAADLMDVWRAAQQHDLDFAAAGAAHRAGEARRTQSDALWRPTVQVSGTAGRMTSETTMNGAQFSAPGFGTSDGVNFNTSITNGTLGRWTLEARQPLLSRERQAQSRQLALSADVADLEWQDAQQALMLNTAQRYFEVALAAESLRVLRQQQAAVNRALAEARDRHALGDTPVTGTFEASARAEAIRAQILAAETDLQLKQIALADVTGLRPEAMNLRFPAADAVPGEVRALDRWLADAADRNPLLRMQSKRTEVATEEAAKYSPAAAPTIDLVASVGQDRLSGSGDYGSALNNASNMMIGVQISVPLYTGGYRNARQEEALYLADKARTDADRTRQKIALQTRAAWMGLTVGAGRIAALAEALRANQARLDSTRVGLAAGDRTTLDVLNAENDAANAELALLQARVDALMDRLRLAALSGQLDEDQLRLVNASLATGPAR
jgi:outer membrane protein